MDELEYIKKLAGVNEFKGYSEYKIDENPSATASAIKQKEREMGIKPGDPEWFKLWFSLPRMNGVPNFRGRKKK
jgi:hypothetical protein